MKKNNIQHKSSNKFLFIGLITPLIIVIFFTFFLDTHITNIELKKDLDESVWKINNSTISIQNQYERNSYLITIKDSCIVKIEGQLFNLDYKNYDTKLMYIEPITQCEEIKIPNMVLEVLKFTNEEIILKQLPQKDLFFIANNVYFEDSTLKEKFLLVYYYLKEYGIKEITSTYSFKNIIY